MRFATVFSFGLLGAAMATPAVKRDSTPFTNAFDAVAKALTAMDTSVLALTPSSDAAAAAADLTVKSDAILAALKSGTEAASAAAALTLVEALPLATASQTLASTAEKVVNDLISKKAIITAAGQAELTLSQLNAQKAATQTFSEAVTAKVPSAAQGIARMSAQKAIDAIDKGIAAFS